MKLWQIFFDDDNSEVTVDTVSGEIQTSSPTSTTEPKIIVKRTDANGSTRTITINTRGGNYNERIEGDYIQRQQINIDL